MRRALPVRRSRAAALSRLIGALAVPVLVLAALAPRVGLVSGAAVLPLIVLGFALGLLAVVVAAVALIDIWKSGAEGAGLAFVGIVYAVPVLILLATIVAAAFLYPGLTDVSTDPADPPALAGGAAVPADEHRRALQAEAYPDVAPRFYLLPIAAVYAAARQLVADRGWTIVGEVPPPSMPVVASAARPVAAVEDSRPFRGKRVITQSRSGAIAPAAAAAPEATAPAVPDTETASVRAVATTPLFSFADDVVVQLEETPAGTRVDMRSASRLGAHDLGQNARRIRRFLTDLDAALEPKPDAPQPAVAAGSPVASEPGSAVTQ